MENKVLYWKLQNKLESPEIKPGTKEYDIYRNHYKVNYESRELMNEVQTIMHHRMNGFKSPLFSQIYSLTIAYVHENQIRVKYITGEEKDLLQTFLNIVKSEHFKEYKIACFEAEVLLPYLGIRLDRNGNKQTLPQDLQYKNMRPWNLTGISVRDYYQGAGVYKPTLKELAYIFNLESNFVDPADEFTLYQADKIKELKESAIDEVFTLVNVHRLIVGEDVVEDLTVVEEKVENVQEEVPSNPIIALYETKQLSGKVKDELIKVLSKKKPTKADRKHMEDILFAHYKEKLDVMDFADVKKEKEDKNEKRKQEIVEFLEEVWPQQK